MTKDKQPIIKQLKTNQLIYPIFITLGVVIIAAIVVLVLSVFRQPTLDDNYFTSDDAKSVINLTTSDSSSSDHQTHVVYEYDGAGNVTSLKTYFEYPDANTAKTNYEATKDQPEFKGAELKDNYIIVTADESQFKGLTADDIRQQEEAIKQFQESQKPKEDSTKQEEEQEESDE